MTGRVYTLRKKQSRKYSSQVMFQGTFACTKMNLAKEHLVHLHEARCIPEENETLTSKHLPVRGVTRQRAGSRTESIQAFLQNPPASGSETQSGSKMCPVLSGLVKESFSVSLQVYSRIL